MDSGNNRVVRFDRDGNFQDEWFEHECNYGDMDYCTQAFEELNSIASGPGETVYLADREKFFISLNQEEGAERILETRHPVSLSPGETRQFTDLTGPVPTPGKYLLEATAQNSLAQVLARATYPFYVAEQDIILTLEPEKKLYRPGELIRISGLVQNRAPAAASGLKLYLLAQNPTGEGLELLSQSIELPAGGSLPISASMVAGGEGSLLLTGLVLSQGTTLLEVLDRLEVEEPKVYRSLDVPEVVGEEPFPVRVNLTNSGRLPVSVGLEIREEGGQIILAQEIDLQGGEKKSLEALYQIQKDTELSFLFTGDLKGSETRKLLYGLSAEIQLSPQAVYSEGPVAVEVSLANTGLLDQRVNVSYQVNPGNMEILRTYSIPAGGTALDTLYFILQEGSYGITASCPKPNVSAQGSFLVRGQNRVALNLSAGVGGGGLVPINAQVSNLGANELGLSVLVEIRDANGGQTWSSREGFPVLSPGSSELINFQIPAETLAPGSYTARVSALSSSGEPLASAEAPFTVKPSSIQVIQTPGYQNFQPGQEAMFSFRLRNSGDQGSNFNLSSQAEDLADSSEQGWLGPGEEKEIFFGAWLPEDLDERDHFGVWELFSSGPAERGTVRFHVAGLNLSVAPSLDKPSYREGETARLTLEIQTSAASPLPLVAQVKYGLFEENRPFTLAGSQGLGFEIPLPEITGERLFFGIYHESGRSIHLNSLSIQKAGDQIHLSTHKQVYEPGETVVVTVEGQTAGYMTLTGPGGYIESFSFSGFASRGVSLPAIMKAGTYGVSARLKTEDSEPITASRTFDVTGLQVKVKEAHLDKAKYLSADTITLSLWVESNESLDAMIRTWVVDAQGDYLEAGEVGVTLSSQEPVPARLSVPFSTTMPGIHRLAYAVFLGDVLLCSGAEAFDVGNALLLGVRTEKSEYPTHTEPVQVEAIFMGEGEGTLEILLDEISQGILPVTLREGTGSLKFSIPSTSPGPHKIKAVLEIQGLTSVKETSFVSGTQLPDLSVELMGILETGHPPQATFSMEIRNQGKGNSPATALALYEESEATLLGIFQVAPLAPGQIQIFSHTGRITGLPGPRTFLLKADPEAQVPEFQERNNEARLTLTLPELWIEISTDKDSYHPGETAQITSRVFYNGTIPLEGLSLETIVRDQAGAQVFSQTMGFDLAAASEVSLEIQWAIPSGISWGTYVLEQQVAGRSLVSSKTLTLIQQQTGFSLSTEPTSLRVEAGETASWVLALNPISGFEGEVFLSVAETVPNSALVLIPNPIRLSGGLGAQAGLKVITTSQSPPGTYSLSVTASSLGSQDTIQLALEIVDFSLSITPAAESVRQRDKATFILRTYPLGNFDGPVSFFLSGIPRGMRAELSATEAAPGEDVALEILTSKWLPPGEHIFEITARGRAASHSVRGILAVEANPKLSPGILTSCFRDYRGRSIIKMFTLEGDWIRDYLASPKAGAVSLAAGDLNGDGMDELVVGTTRGGVFSPAKIRVLGGNGKLITEIATEHRGWLHPLNVTVGDLDGDWKEEIVVGLSTFEELQEDPWSCPMTGQGMVKAYKLEGAVLVEAGLSFVPYPERWSWRAPNVALGDTDGDGHPELITTPGSTPLAPALVRVFQVEPREPGQWEAGSLKAEWEVDFSPSHRSWVGYGANVSPADLDCDGRDEIMVGAPSGPRSKGEVVVLRPSTQEQGGNVQELLVAFEEGRGAYVAGRDLDGDSCAEIVVGQGAGPKTEAKVLVFKGDGTLLRELQTDCQPAHLGVRVAVGALGD